MTYLSPIKFSLYLFRRNLLKHANSLVARCAHHGRNPHKKWKNPALHYLESGVSVFLITQTHVKQAAFIGKSVHHPNEECQITGKGHPNQIRDLQYCCSWTNCPKGGNHGDDQKPQKQQPEKGEAIHLKVKKQRTPNQINN